MPNDNPADIAGRLASLPAELRALVPEGLDTDAMVEHTRRLEAYAEPTLPRPGGGRAGRGHVGERARPQRVRAGCVGWSE